MPSREYYARYWSDLRKMQHTGTLNMNAEQLTEMRRWLREHAQGRWYYVQRRKTKRAKQTGLYSVVVYLDDDGMLWTRFLLTRT